MTLFRYKKNGLLYTIYRVTPRHVMGWWYEAHPYRHNVNIGMKRPGPVQPKNVCFYPNMSLNDFEEVAYA